jgi:curved DNA-binding protein
MTSAHPFVDFYSILKVHPQCDAKTLETAYRDLAKIYHPDHPETADTEKFQQVLEAYRALKNPDDRATYNITYAINTSFSFDLQSNETIIDRSAPSDLDAHTKTLLHLYKRRREHANDPGVGQYDLQKMLDCSDETFDFYVWYLKGKGYIEYTEDGTLAITIAGVDHVIALSQVRAQEKLQIAQVRPEVSEAGSATSQTDPAD